MLELIEAHGPQGGPTYTYRGATIHTSWDGTRYELVLDAFPHSPRQNLGNLEVIQWVVDLWVDRDAVHMPDDRP